MNGQRVCSVAGCDRHVRALGMCAGHWQRLRKFGDVRADQPFRQVTPSAAGNGCAVEGCERPYLSGGYCAPHYSRVRRYGSPVADKQITKRGELGGRGLLDDPTACSVDGCDRPYAAKGFCAAHYARARSQKGLRARVPVGLNFGRRKAPDSWFWGRAVESPSGCWEWTGRIDKDGYGRSHGGAHQIAYRRMIGEIPPGLHLDHLCRNRRCVNPYHLEPVSPAENTRRGLLADRGEWTPDLLPAYALPSTVEAS